MTEEGWARWTGSILMSNDLLPALRSARVAWNKGRIIGQKRPLLPRHVWSIRVRLEMAVDLPLVFHPAATGARWSFTPVGAG
jgi:hypothetical protein